MHVNAASAAPLAKRASERPIAPPTGLRCVSASNYPASAASANLDMLRAIAVLLVFGAHLSETMIAAETDLTWKIGQMGVLAFFVHTALVLHRSLHRSRPDERLGVFYTRRIFRIYPLSIVCVSIAFFFASPQSWTWSEYVQNVTLTQNLVSLHPVHMVKGLWTLPIEVQMYAFLPFTYRLVKSRPVWVALVLWAISIPAAYLQPMLISRAQVLSYAPCFLGGVVAFAMARKVTPRIAGLWWPIGMLAVAPVWMLASRDTMMWGRWMFGLALGLAIPLFRESACGWLNRASAVIAKYSYGIYLSHFAVILFAWSHLESLPARLAFVVTGVAIASYVMFHAIEAPMMRAGNRLTRRDKWKTAGN